jgi:ADP-ribose pyrophosphatase
MPRSTTEQERTFTPLGGETIHEGHVITVRTERFRYADGEEVERDVVRHDGAVAVVAHDGEAVYLVLQPREAVGEASVLELPAGRLDKEGESPLEAAKRELAEEIGKAATEWRVVASFYTSPGFTDERVTVYAATDLSEAQAESDEEERIEIVPWPLQRLDEAIADCQDSKSLIGLLWLARERDRAR